MTWNRAKLRQDTKKQGEDLRTFKKHLREPGHMIGGSEFQRLQNLKLRATILCAIIAHSHGKIHITKHFKYTKSKKLPSGFWEHKEFLYENGMTLEQQEAFIAEYAAEYQLPLETESAATV